MEKQGIKGRKKATTYTSQAFQSFRLTPTPRYQDYWETKEVICDR